MEAIDITEAKPKYPAGTHYYIDQGTDEWKALRAGKITGSQAADVFNVTAKGAPGSKRNLLLRRLVAERIMGMPVETPTSMAMRWGVDHEDQACSEFHGLSNLDMQRVGFVEHPTIPNFGASPDALVGDDAFLEVKCPEPSTQIDRYLSVNIDDPQVPEAYRFQMLSLFATTGREWGFFMSYDPRMPEFSPARCFIITMKRPKEELEIFEEGIAAFEKEVSATYEHVMNSSEMLRENFFSEYFLSQQGDAE